MNAALTITMIFLIAVGICFFLLSEEDEKIKNEKDKDISEYLEKRHDQIKELTEHVGSLSESVSKLEKRQDKLEKKHKKTTDL